MGELLEKYTTNISQRLADNPSPIIGRTLQIQEVINALLRATKNAPLLVGEPGVGKTAIVEGVAQRLLTGTVPARLKGYEVLTLDLASMTGESFERDFAQLIQEIIEESWHYLLFIDEFHMVMGTGKQKGTLDAANILKPALGRGDFKLIGATTTDEYHKFLESDGALERRITVVNVPEPSHDETVLIMNGVIDEKLSRVHNVKYEPSAIEAAVTLSDRYLTTKYQPDKSYDFLDSAGARVELDDSRTTKLVTISDVQNELEQLAGIPTGALQRTKFERLALLEERLSTNVIGQPVANDAVVKVVRRSLTGLTRQGKPLGNLLFIGPTGVGKTAMVKQLAQTMFDSERNIIRFDMSEFSLSETVQRFKKQLTRQVKLQPYTVVLLDEIEKAHPLIFDLFLQVFDDGILNDEFGRQVSFKNAFIIATSNMGYELMTDSRNTLGAGDSDVVQTVDELSEDFEFVKKTMQNELKRKFRPEFLNRLDDIVIFNFLGVNTIKRITKQTIDESVRVFQSQYPSTTVLYDSNLVDYILHVGFDPNNGARPVQRTVETTIMDKLSEIILSNADRQGNLPIQKIEFILEGDTPTGFNDHRQLRAKVTTF